MGTLVLFHAHPDDEAIATGGTMALAAAAGHDVVLVVATRGEQGEPVPGVLAPGEALWERRVAETHASAALLGVSEVVFLGYEDSGMMGEPTNDNPACFWQADPDEAADRLAAVLESVGADVLTCYDAHGGYGHPDHIQVHRVGHLAARRAGLGGGSSASLFEATMNRTRMTELMAAAAELLESPDADVGAHETSGAEATAADVASEPDFGTPEEGITHAIDVTTVLDAKRAAMAAHASQVAADSFFLTLPDDAFAAAFGTEWFILPDAPRPAGGPFTTRLL
jgi:LmbE family N-acetylglucosaminyl deacetylase